MNYSGLHSGEKRVKNKILKSVCLFIMFVLAISSLFAQDTECHGLFRWEVKTLTDPGGSELLKTGLTGSTVSQLLAVQPPKHFFIFSAKDAALPRYESEKQVVRIRAFVVSVKTERDRDLHIILKSPDSDETMIGEIPDPDCAIFDSLPELKMQYKAARVQLKLVREQLEAIRQPVLVEITGVPFWDARHWWLRGCAKNGREIHPVLSVKILHQQ
jgi:hypothetical protein